MIPLILPLYLVHIVNQRKRVKYLWPTFNELHDPPLFIFKIIYIISSFRRSVNYRPFNRRFTTYTILCIALVRFKNVKISVNAEQKLHFPNPLTYGINFVPGKQYSRTFRKKKKIIICNLHSNPSAGNNIDADPCGQAVVI
jgi:hypothetical protein